MCIRDRPRADTADKDLEREANLGQLSSFSGGDRGGTEHEEVGVNYPHPYKGNHDATPGTKLTAATGGKSGGQGSIVEIEVHGPMKLTRILQSMRSVIRGLRNGAGRKELRVREAELKDDRELPSLPLTPAIIVGITSTFLLARWLKRVRSKR